MSSTATTTVSEQSNASTGTPSVIAGLSAPKRPSAAKHTAKPATKPTAKITAKTDARPLSQRKVSIMNAMIHASADLVRTDASFKSAQRKYADLRDVTRDEARTLLAARLSYAPGDEWDDALPAPTKLQAGKRSAIARTAAAQRVTRPAKKTAHKSTKPATKSA